MIKKRFLQFGRTGDSKIIVKFLSLYPYVQIKRKMRIAFIFLCILFLFISCENKSSMNTRAFEFTYSVNLEPSGNNKLELWIPLPQTNEVQIISNLNIDSQDLEYEIKDEIDHGNKYVYLYAEEGIKRAKEVIMTFNVIRKEHQNIDYNNIKASEYLEASAMVPKGDMFIEIIEGNKLSSSDIRGLYDFVLSGMHYGKPKSTNDEYYKEPWLSSKGKYGLKKVSRDDVVDLYEKAGKDGNTYTFGNGNSLYACNIGVGNCTDYHSYFISLARTMNIPARFHMGFPISNSKEGEIGGYHCWADYYIEDEGWYPVDISEADKDSNRVDYFFGTVCNNRLEMMIGRDFKLDGYKEKTVNFFIYPILEINDEKSENFTKRFSYKKL